MSTPLRLASRMAEFLESLLFLCASLAFIAIALIENANILLRYFGAGVTDSIVFIEIMMVSAIAFSLSYAQRRDAHISVDIVFNYLPARARTACLYLSLVVGFTLAFAVAYWAWGEFSSALSRGKFYTGRLHLPEWPSRLAFFAGFALLSLRIMIQLADRPQPGPPPSKSAAVLPTTPE